MKTHVYLFFLVLVSAISCKKASVTPPEDLPPLTTSPATGQSITLNLSHVANGSPFALGATNTYTTANNDTFSVRLFKYYLSNIALLDAAGHAFAVPNSYFLVDEDDATSKTITLQGLPEGDYRSIRFMIGVDSARNVSGVQSGALDPAHGMFWTWNSGYIMAKIEGSSPQSGNALKDIAFHIGGFSGTNKGIRTVTLPFPTDLHVHAGHVSQVNMEGDVARWFSGPNAIDFSVVYEVTTVNSRSRIIADNYATMFTVTSIVN